MILINKLCEWLKYTLTLQKQKKSLNSLNYKCHRCDPNISVEIDPYILFSHLVYDLVGYTHAKNFSIKTRQ